MAAAECNIGIESFCSILAIITASCSVHVPDYNNQIIEFNLDQSRKKIQNKPLSMA